MTRVRNHGKYTHMQRKNPRGIGRCDYSGLMTRQTSMVDQLQYAGTGLFKTGLRVNPKFYDIPNPQNLTPLILLDPPPLVNPRPDAQIDVYNPQTLTLDISGSGPLLLTEAQYANNQFNWIGELTGDRTILIPGTFNDFLSYNLTTLANPDYTLTMQINNIPTYVITLIPKIQMLIATDGYGRLYIINPS
jgi:hypothetical protein